MAKFDSNPLFGQKPGQFLSILREIGGFCEVLKDLKGEGEKGVVLRGKRGCFEGKKGCCFEGKKRAV